MATRRRRAEKNAIPGATTAGIATLCASPCHWTPCVHDCAIAAPTRPPMSAWEEDDGSPRHHVIRFQTIAPISAASTVLVVARSESTIPLPIVFATAVVTNAPARFAAAAIATAVRGPSARVETDVATAFAVSWKPFVKSKPSATTITTTSSAVFTAAASAVLDQDRFEHVGGVLAGVDRLLELLVQLFPADDRDRVLAGTKEAGDGVADDPVALVLELAQLDELLLRVSEALEQPDRLVQLLRGADDDIGLLTSLRGDLADAVEA